MGLFGKIANIASGGLLGMAKGVAKGNPKAILSGGMFGGSSRPQGGSPFPGVPGGFLSNMLMRHYGQMPQGPMGEMPQGGGLPWGVQMAQQGMGGWAPQMGAGGFQPLPAQGQAAPQAPQPPPAPVEQPTDYQALAEQQAANKARRANYKVNQ